MSWHRWPAGVVLPPCPRAGRGGETGLRGRMLSCTRPSSRPAPAASRWVTVTRCTGRWPAPLVVCRRSGCAAARVPRPRPAAGGTSIPPDTGRSSARGRTPTCPSRRRRAAPQRAGAVLAAGLRPAGDALPGTRLLPGRQRSARQHGQDRAPPRHADPTASATFPARWTPRGNCTRHGRRAAWSSSATPVTSAEAWASNSPPPSTPWPTNCAPHRTPKGARSPLRSAAIFTAMRWPCRSDRRYGERCPLPADWPAQRRSAGCARSSWPFFFTEHGARLSGTAFLAA
jgi:hypothetical protein